MNEKIYPSDLTNEAWEWIKDLILAAKSGGRPHTLCMRAVRNAIFYVTKGGSQWRRLLTNFPKWQSVYHYLRAWKLPGVWVRITTRYAPESEPKRSGIHIPPRGVWRVSR